MAEPPNRVWQNIGARAVSCCNICPASPFVAAEGGTGEAGLLVAADLVSGETEENWTRVNFHLDTMRRPRTDWSDDNACNTAHTAFSRRKSTHF